MLVVIGAGVVCFGRGFMHRYLEEILPVFYLGLSLNVFCVAFMTLLVFCPSLTEFFLCKGLALLERAGNWGNPWRCTGRRRCT